MPNPIESELAKLVQPMPGRIVVLVRTTSERTPSGLFIPEETARSIHEERVTQGVIVAMSSDEDDDLSDDLAVGDTVLFGKFNGFSITYQPDRSKPKERVVVLERKNVFAKLRDPDVQLKIKQ